MNKKTNKAPNIKQNRAISSDQKNKSLVKKPNNKIGKKNGNKSKSPTKNKSKDSIKQLSKIQKNHKIIWKMEKISQNSQSDNVTKHNWEKTSQSMLIDNIFNRLNINTQSEGNKGEIDKKEKESNKDLSEKQKKWFNNLKDSMKNSMKTFNDSQKKALDNLEKSILDKLSSKDKEDEFLKEILLLLIAQNAFSKDLQNLGQVNVSSAEHESYL